MAGRLARALESPRLRGALTYPFRLGPVDSDWAGTPFAGLATVNNLSGAGDALVTVALAGSVFVSVSLHAARGRTALGLLCTVAPFVLVGPFIGPAIDRVRGGRKFIVFAAAIGRLAACLMMASWIHSLLLFPAAFLSLVCSKTHAVAKAALVPGVVDDEADLVRANARLAVGGAVCTTLAAGLGGAVYKLLGSKVLLDLDVLVFSACAGLSLYLLRHTADTAPARAAAVVPPPRRGRLGLGRNPLDVPRSLSLASVAMAGMRGVAGFLTALVVFAFRRQGAPLIWYGLVGGASVAGNFVGALVAPRLGARIRERYLVGAAAVLIAAVALAATFMAGAHRRPAALLLAATVAVGASAAKTAFDAIVQRETVDEERSRLFARFESIFQLAWVAGALIPTLIPTSLLIGYVLTALTVVATSAVFVSGLARPAPDPPGAWPPVPSGPPVGSGPLAPSGSGGSPGPSVGSGPPVGSGPLGDSGPLAGSGPPVGAGPLGGWPPVGSSPPAGGPWGAPIRPPQGAGP